MACIIGAAPTALIVYAMAASRQERMAHIPALLLGALIAAGGPLFFWVSRALWARTEVTLPAGD
jgi:hypothetical protein